MNKSWHLIVIKKMEKNLSKQLNYIKWEFILWPLLSKDLHYYYLNLISKNKKLKVVNEPIYDMDLNNTISELNNEISHIAFIEHYQKK